MRSIRFFATCPRGVEPLLADEAAEVGLNNIKRGRGGIRFSGPLTDGMRAVLWLRTANRVLLHLRAFPAVDADTLYSGVRDIPWERHLSETSTFCIDAIGTTPALRHTHFIGVRVKDAIADRLTQALGSRPDVEPQNPDVRIVTHLSGGQCTISLDLAGTPLHKRGYRKSKVSAPLRETLAAAILRWTDWRAEVPLVDPMCGSGTLIIEAAMMATRRAPGLGLRPSFLRWPSAHENDATAWRELCQQASEAILEKSPVQLMASDLDPRAVAATRANLRAAGLHSEVECKQADMRNVDLPTGPGLVITNPPYGARMGEEPEAARLLRALAQTSARWKNFRTIVFSGHPDSLELLNAAPGPAATLFNGALECWLVEPQADRATSRPRTR